MHLYFDGDNPVFLKSGVTDDTNGTLHLKTSFRHVFDLEELDTSDTETVYKLPETYSALSDCGAAEGILIYSDYAYAAVRESDGLRLYALSPGAPTLLWEEFYELAFRHAREKSELSGIENYGL